MSPFAGLAQMLLSGTWSERLVVALALNGALTLATVGLGEFLRRRFSARSVEAHLPFPEVTPKGTRALVAIATVLNGFVLFAGEELTLRGVIRLNGNESMFTVVADLFLLGGLMDLAMYVFHRGAHLPFLYEKIHAIHHRYVHVRPVHLFALHPVEVVGFGGLWLAVLALRPATPTAIVLFLALNSFFGVAGHLGVEFLPKKWANAPILRSVGTSTFHAQHHQEPRTNFGFYTLLWDRLFRTIHAEYTALFPK